MPNVDQVGTVVGAPSGGGNTRVPRSPGFCNITPAWWDGVGSQAKVQVVCPLPYAFAISGSYKNLPGIPIAATVS